MTVVLVDCKNLASYSGGISAFFKPLLARLISHYNDFKFILLAPNEFDTEFLSKYSNWEVELVPYLRTGMSKVDIVIYDFYIFPNRMKKKSANFLISPYYDFLIPNKYRNKSLITVHDMCYWDLKDIYSRKVRWYYSFLLRYNLNRVYGVVTVSKASLISFFNYFGEKKEKIKAEVVYNTFQPRKKREIEVDKFRSDEMVYIIYTGGVEERKNIEMMFKVMSLIRRKVLFKLVFTGDFERNKYLKEMITRFGLSDLVLLTGLISSKELTSYYEKSDVVINLSLCEGFGRSNLEAVQYNKPLVCSDIPVFRELVDGYAIFCDPLNEKSIEDAILASLKIKPNYNDFSFDRFDLSSNSKKMIDLIEGMMSEQ